MKVRSTIYTVLTFGISAMASLAWSQPSDAVTYKGVALGASLAEYKEKLPDHRCYSADCDFSIKLCVSERPVPGECSSRNSFGGARIERATAKFREAQLAYVLLMTASREISPLIDVLRERLGPPTKLSEEPFKTRGGLTAENVEAIWETPSMHLKVRRHGTSLGEGIVVLTTPTELAALAQDRAAKVKQGAKDF